MPWSALAPEGGAQLGATGSDAAGPANVVVPVVLVGVDPGGGGSSQLGARFGVTDLRLAVAVLDGWHRVSFPDRGGVASASKTDVCGTRRLHSQPAFTRSSCVNPTVE